MRLARMDAHESRLSWKLIFHTKLFLYASSGLATVCLDKTFFSGTEKKFFLVRHEMIQPGKMGGTHPAAMAGGHFIRGSSLPLIY
jgi:hypothetical protein